MSGRRASPGKGASRLREGCLVLSTHPPSAACLLGRQLWSAADMLLVRMCRVGIPATALWLVCRAGRCGRREWQELARGGSPGRGERCLGLGALPLPAARPWGRWPGPVACISQVRREVGIEAHDRFHSTRSCEPALRALGVAGRHPRRGPLVFLRGAPGVRRPPSTGCPSLEQAAGIHCPHAVGAGVQAREPGTGPSACMPCCVLRAAGLLGGHPGGGLSPPS